MLKMTQSITSGGGMSMMSLACPISVDGERPVYDRGAPKLGAQTEAIRKEFGI